MQSTDCLPLHPYTYGCSENDIPLPDEYDQISHDLNPFKALSPTEIQKRLKLSLNIPEAYVISVRSGSVTASFTPGTHGHALETAKDRLAGQLGLIEPVAALLEDFTAIYSVHEPAVHLLGFEHRRELGEHLERGECMY